MQALAYARDAHAQESKNRIFAPAAAHALALAHAHAFAHAYAHAAPTPPPSSVGAIADLVDPATSAAAVRARKAMLRARASHGTRRVCALWRAASPLT